VFTRSSHDRPYPRQGPGKQDHGGVRDVGELEFGFVQFFFRPVVEVHPIESVTDPEPVEVAVRPAHHLLEDHVELVEPKQAGARSPAVIQQADLRVQRSNATPDSTCPRRDYNPCMYRHHILHLGAWLPIALIIAILIFAFEIWMIVDAAINKEITDKARAWWIIGMLVIHPFVAIAYFFTDHRKR